LALLAARVAGVWARARGVAVFRCRRQRLSLLASDRVAQGSIDYLRRLWAEDFAAVAQGSVHADAADSNWLHLVIPCRSAGRMLGLLYAQVPPDRVPPVEALHALGAVAGAILDRRTVVDALHASVPLPGGLQAAPFAAAANLRAVMQHHEWNIARVARVLGVTRMTVYNRLRRHKIQREHVRKGRPRGTSPRSSPGTRPELPAKPIRGAA
jgi:hypothetical protein